MNRTLVSRAFDRSPLQTDKFDVPTFGKPTRNNHGWVRCDSRSFPGMSYYFNVVTCCSTWVRPVPSFVATPYFRPENRPSDEEFTDKTPLEVSDIEDDEEDEQEEDFTKDSKSLFISKKEARQKKIYAEVLYKMYHCYGDEWDIDVMDKFTSIETDPFLCKCEPIEENASSNDSQLFLPEICYSSSSKSETSDSSCTDSRSMKNRIRTDSLDSASTLIVGTKKPFESTRIKFKDLGYHEKFDSGFMIDYHRSSLTDDLEDNNNNEVQFKIEDQNKWSMSISGSEDSDKDFRRIKLSSGDDEENDEEEGNDEQEEEEEKENNNVKHYNCQFSLPKLKVIQFPDLLSSTPKIKIPKKDLRRKSDRSKCVKIEEESENIAPKRAKKMIFELNGVKTINYDFVTPELPPGVKMSNLSDSENSTIFDRRYSLYDREKSPNKFHIGTKIEVKKISDDDFMDVNEPDLSHSSTTSSSSQNLKQDTRTDCLNDSHATTDSESSSSSSSSTNSTNDQKKNFNVARADESSESDSSETSSTSSSTSAESLETKIKKLPDVVGFHVKLENLETNELSVSDQKGQSFDEPSKSWTRSNVSRARKYSESSSSSSSSTNSKNDQKKNFNVARADESSESDSSETSSTSSSTSAESLETKIKKLPDVVGFGVKLENFETNELSASDQKEQSFDEPSKAWTRSNVSRARKYSESSSSSSSSTNSKNDQKKNFNVARADESSESDSSETSSTSSSTSAESLETKIEKLPDVAGFGVKLENFETNELSASDQKEQSFDEPSKSWTRSNVSRARKDSESSSSSSSSMNSKNDQKKNFNVARADESSESDSSETSSTSSSTSAESLEIKIEKLPDVAGFGVKLENFETNELSASDQKEQSFDEPSKAWTRSNVSRARKYSESSSSSSSSTNSKNDQKKNFNVARVDELSESDSSSISAESLQTKIKKLPDISGFVVKLENLDVNEWYISNQKEKSFYESPKAWKAVAGDICLDSSRSITSPSNSSDVTWKISDDSDSDED